MIQIQQIIIPFLVAIISTLWIHPKVLKIAKMKNIVDNPDARKLQRRPTPVMGGVAVFFGIILGLSSSQIILVNYIFIYVAAMIVLLYIGTMDDILNLSPKLRFSFEIAVIAIIILVTDNSISNFYGLWSIYEIPTWFSVPLTIFSAVGIINGINLIDGVNGLSTGFCIMASVLFGIFFYITDNIAMLIIAASVIGAVIPFFLHNVFGNETRMFIGDGGSLMIGVIMSLFIMDILSACSSHSIAIDDNVGLVPFCLAVMSIPVFDTVRVMSQRILRGVSPFHADKTHLHHMFISLGFSHIGTTMSILSLNMSVVLIWWASYLLGASIDIQLYIVLCLSILCTFVLYAVVEYKKKKESRTIKIFNKIGEVTHFEKKGIWKTTERLIDKI